MSTLRWHRLRATIWTRDGGRCVYCGAALDPATWTVDHRVPVVRGGRTCERNLVACCPPCNHDKAARTPEEWACRLEADSGRQVPPREFGTWAERWPGIFAARRRAA